MKKLIALLVIAGGIGCAVDAPQRACCDHSAKVEPAARAALAAEVADVKTCGCPKTATCGDCCGPKHCPCNPSD